MLTFGRNIQRVVGNVKNENGRVMLRRRYNIFPVGFSDAEMIKITINQKPNIVTGTVEFQTE